MQERGVGIMVLLTHQHQLPSVTSELTHCLGFCLSSFPKSLSPAAAALLYDNLYPPEVIM